MPAPYSTDLRVRVLADCDGGLGTSAVARKYRVSERWVRELKRVRRETGRVAPLPHAGGRTPAAAAHGEAIRAAVAGAPDATLAEHLSRLARPVSRSALGRALRALRLTRKKSRSGRPSGTART